MKKLVYLLVWMAVGVSCGDFLSEYPKDLLYANTIEDVDELLVGEGYMLTQEPESVEGTIAIQTWMHVMDDDIESIVHDKNDELPYPLFAEWRRNPFYTQSGATIEDRTWSALYAHIGALNVILNKLEDFKAEKDYARIRGEALFLRAAYYFWLVNIYAQPFRQEDAKDEPGVPIKLTDYVEGKSYSRHSVAEVYETILTDLKEAARYLRGVKQSTVYRVNAAAVHAFASRVYLYMEDFDNVVKQCDSVFLAGNYSLLDLNQHTSNKSMIFSGSPETIFSQGENRFLMLSDKYINSYVVSEDLRNAFPDQVNDLRFKFFQYFTHWKSRKKGYLIRKFYTYSNGIVSDCFLIRVPEVYLNKAEALAMQGKAGEAVKLIQTLRANRFVTGTLPDLSEEGLVAFIRDERRRELCFEGHRWFDLRRYGVSKVPMAKEIRHPHWEANAVSESYEIERYYVLKPYSEDRSNYVLPIPQKELLINEGTMVGNERTESEFIKL